MKATLKKVHRYLSLALAAVWLVQALTGAIMVFHWELDDVLVPGPSQSIDPEAVAAAAERVQTERADAKVVAFYATAGTPDRFDVHVEDAEGRTDIVRVDGAGRRLVARPLDYDYRRAGFIQAAIVLHQTLFAGDRGKFFLGFSALCLLTNLVLGLKLAWPRRGEWRRALMPPAVRAGAAKIFAWHRACGLWLALPAFILVTAGMLLAFEDPLEELLGTGATPSALEGVTSAQVTSLGTARIAAGEALRVALARFPAAKLSSLRMPSADSPWYRVRVLQAGEPARVYGSTAIYVSAEDGRVLAVENALEAPARQRFVNLLFPVHTGEVAGLPGRLLVLAVSLWLLTMLTLGITLWAVRRKPASVRSSAV
ncbi:MAG TPA: PepSY-associated TM helix domain-containing protein [Steroidobacteraceae bacterium]|nr:PepSY-associated TM helix domain-containing protein [Steroidobacteraceae bacterium]